MIKILRFIPIQLTFFLVFGILLANNTQPAPDFLLIVISILFLVLCFFYKQSSNRIYLGIHFQLCSLLLSFFIGMGAVVFKNPLNKRHHYVNLTDFSEREPIRATVSILKVLKPNTYYYRYEGSLEQIENIPVKGKVLLHVERDTFSSSLKVDDRIVFIGMIQQIKEPLNPYGFNYKNYLINQQIYHQIRLSENQLLQFLEGGQSIRGLAADIRERINYSLQKNRFKNDELALINALLLGQRNGISSDLRQSYVRAGAIHILAISGLHIGILLMILMELFKPLHQFRHGKSIALFFTIIFLWAYATLSGLSASVVRACTMFTAVALGMRFNRPTNVYNTLIISIFILLLVHPNFLFEVGFQLSYLAVFSIVWLQPKIASVLNPRFWLMRKIWDLFTVSLAAQIGVLPLSLFYFHQFPGLFFLSNLIIIPFLGILLIGGFTLIILSLLNLLPELFACSYRFIISEMNEFVSWISKQETFLIENISFSYLLMLASYGLLISSVLWTEKRNYFRWLLLLLSIINLQGVVIWERQQLLSKKEFIVFHKSRESITGIRNGRDFRLRTSIRSINRREPSLNTYMVHEGIKSWQIQSNSIGNTLKFDQESILIVDSLSFYKTRAFDPTIIILQNSPKINLERLIAWHHPKLIVADGSNYKSYVKKWEVTCSQKKTPFHSTLQKGAFILKE